MNSNSSSSPVFFDAGLVARHLPWQPLIDALRAAFAADDVSAPTRSHHRLDGVASGSPMLLTMPAWSARLGVGTKLVAVYPDNHQHALPSIHGLYVLMEAATGRPQAVLDGGELTSRRTAAASALASQCLSRPDSRTLLMVGTGRLSQYLPLAHARVRPIDRVLVWGRSLDKSQAAARELTAAGLPAQAIESLQAGCAEADIISCATLAREAVLHGDWLRPGTHVDLVGAFTPTMCEADGRVFERAVAVYGDTLDGVLAEAGDVIQALASGALQRQQLMGGLADLCRATVPPVRTDTAITVFKSVGAALEDLVAARLCLDLYSPLSKA
ncbi:MAG: ornithine cyclodeaminase family protein [Polaromonas sp.]